MTTTAILSEVRHMLFVALLLVSPFLMTAIATSFVVGVLQASTRINDLTLSFIPRFAAVMLMVYFAASWAARQMVAYVEQSALAMRAISG